MEKIYPNKLQINDEIRVLSPSSSIKRVNTEADNEQLVKYFEKLGYKISYSRHIDEMDEMNSASIKSRVEDLHEAFRDPQVKMILTSIGGFNSNELLPYLDYNLIKKNPKILCGYSDITALQNAIFAKTGLVTYSGPAYSSFKMKELQEYQLNAWLAAMTKHSYNLNPSEFYSSDEWFIPEKPRNLKENEWTEYSSGKASGTAIVGNLNTFNLLQGTQYMPQVDDAILFIESAEENDAFDFARNLASLLQVYPEPAAVIIGRFPKESDMSEDTLHYILNKHSILQSIPVIYNVNFGHTQPIFTFPIGGTVAINTAALSLSVVQG